MVVITTGPVQAPHGIASGDSSFTNDAKSGELPTVIESDNSRGNCETDGAAGDSSLPQLFPCNAEETVYVPGRALTESIFAASVLGEEGGRRIGKKRNNQRRRNVLWWSGLVWCETSTIEAPPARYQPQPELRAEAPVGAQKLRCRDLGLV